MKVEIDNLLTVKNYALKHKITPSYVYKLAKAGSLEVVFIDGVQFVDFVKYPTPAKR